MVKQNLSSKIAKLVLFAVLFSGAAELNGCAPASASASADYDYGVTAYKARNYVLAAQYFKKAAAGGNNTPMTWLYMGHCYSGAGDRARAVESYRKLADDFPKAPEAQMGIQCLLRLQPSLASKYHLLPVSIPTQPAAVVPLADPKSALINRIVVVPPLAGHPPVSQATIATARSVVSRLPRNIYDYLDKGGATVNLAPNIEDKWPGSGDGKKETVADGTMGEEPGRTYGHDVHVYEREKERGRNVLKGPRDQDEIARICYHELGHAVDDISGQVSKTPQFKALVATDLQAMPADIKAAEAYYTTEGEACAEIIGRVLAGSDNDFTSHMPQTKAFLRNKFHI